MRFTVVKAFTLGGIVAIKIITGDCRDVLKTLDEKSINTCVTSPPYFGLRDYGHDGQIGLEETPQEYVDQLVLVFREVWRVLRDDGTVWLNLGDSYASFRDGKCVPNTIDENQKTMPTKGAKNRSAKTFAGSVVKHKDLIGIPWRVAFALQDDGWYLRQDIIWHKPNPMPESVTDRCTKSHEYIFLLSKKPNYYFDHDAIKIPVKQDWGTRDRENGKYHNEGTGLSPHSGLEKSYEFANKRSVWTVTTKGFEGAHFATFPPDLIEPCILAGCPIEGVVLDPFGGSGTTGLVADRNKRDAILIEINQEYSKMASDRCNDDAPLFVTTENIKMEKEHENQTQKD